MYECFHCGNKDVMWDSDFTYDDYALDGEGVVHVLHCENCGAYIEYYIDQNEEKPIMSYEYRITIPINNKNYSVPIKWMSLWVRHNTTFESLNAFMKSGSDDLKKEAIKAAKKEGECKKI